MLHTLSVFLLKIPFISKCYLFWFLYYSYFTYRVCQILNVKLIEVREYLLSFGAESVVFQVAIQNLKDQDI